MVHPSEVKPRISEQDIFKNLCDEFEKFVDRHIKNADDNDIWPCRVPRTRESIPVEVVEHVAKMYEDAGWRVSPREFHGNGPRLVIDRP